MNTCRSRIRELLPEYVYGLLDPEETGRITDHLEICRECIAEVHLLRQFADENLPDPEPWFFSGLPGKVTVEIEARRKKKTRLLIPVWAGGAAAAALAVAMFLLPGAVSELQTNMAEYALVEAKGAFSMGLEEEILSAPGILVDALDQDIGQDLGAVSGDILFSMSTFLEGGVYETMDEETIKIFETLLEEMTPEKIRKKVMS